MGANGSDFEMKGPLVGMTEGTFYIRKRGLDVGSGVFAVNYSTKALTLASFSSLTAGSGVAISSSVPGAARFFADDNGANIGASVRGVQSRFLVTTSQSGGTIRALQGQLKVATSKNFATGIYTALQGYVELAGTHTITSGTFSCIDASLEIGTAMTVTTEAYGVHIETTGSGTITNNGVCAAVGITKASGAASWPFAVYSSGAAIKAAYYNVDLGTITGEEHAWSLVSTGALSSGDNSVGVNVVHTATGTAATWVSAAYFKALQASKAVNGYICAAEFELTSTAANASDHAGIVINMTCNHTGSVPNSPYIMLRDYGTTHATALFAFGASGGADTGMVGSTSSATLLSTAGAGFEANCDYTVRCTVGGTPIWLLASTTGPS